MRDECEETYGFLPCSTSLGGSISLMVIYGYLLLQGATCLSDGSELLLEVLSPGLIGGLLLPVLGALPDSAIIVCSGLGVSHAAAQEQVAVGIGTLAGSTIMLLTVVWAGSLVVGRCDLDYSGARPKAINKKLTRPWDWLRTGVSTDRFTPTNATIMAATAATYLVIQVPALLGDKRDRIVAASGAAVCFATLAVYCVYQIINPELQKRRIRKARRRIFRMEAIREMARRMQPYGELLADDGTVDRDVVMQLFDFTDEDKSGTIDDGELRALLMGLSLGSPATVDKSEELRHWMAEFDKNADGHVGRDEFYNVFVRWVEEKKAAHAQCRHKPLTAYQSGFEMLIDMLPQSESLDIDELEGHDSDGNEPNDGEGLAAPLLEGGHAPPNLDEISAHLKLTRGDSMADCISEDSPSPRQITGKAVALLVLGTVVCALFSDPMVQAVTSFSAASGVPTFFVAFCVTPLASNASELVSSLQFASRKRQKNISLTFSQVYGAVTMNNTLVLGLFLLVCFFQKLEWTFTSEVLVTVSVTLAMGVLGASSTTFRTVWAPVVMLLYPASLLTVWVLDHCFGVK